MHETSAAPRGGRPAGLSTPLRSSLPVVALANDTGGTPMASRPGACATSVDNSEADDEAVTDSIVQWIRAARWYNEPLIQIDDGHLVALNGNDFIAFLDRQHRVGRWSAHENRMRLRDAGFTYQRGYWGKRPAWVIRDEQFHEAVDDALKDYHRRALAEKGPAT